MRIVVRGGAARLVARLDQVARGFLVHGRAKHFIKSRGMNPPHRAANFLMRRIDNPRLRRLGQERPYRHGLLAPRRHLDFGF